jgi:propionyl-CoA carboxylase alpha chain
VSYRFDRDGRLEKLQVGDALMSDARLFQCAAGEVDMEAGGVRRRYEVRAGEGSVVYTQSALATMTLHELPRFPVPETVSAAGSLLAPMPGIVISVLVGVGEVVERGQPLILIEAMKMEHEIVAPADGLLAELHVEEGHQVQTGTVLAVVSDESAD